MKISFSKKPITCLEDESVFKVVSKMDRNKIKSLPIVNAKNELKGIFSASRALYDLKNPDEFTKVKSVKHRTASIKVGEDEEEAIKLMSNTGFEAIPVLEKGKVVGLISDYDILDKFKSTSLFKHMLVTDLMQKPVSLKFGEPIAKARELMNKNRMDSIPVYKNNKLHGIAVASKMIERFISVPKIRQRNIQRGSGVKIKSSSIPVEAIINKSVVPVDDTDSLESGVQKLLKYNLISLPVVKNGKTVGVFRRIDVINYLNKKIKSDNLIINVSGKADLEESKNIINQVYDRVRSQSYLFKKTKKIDVYIKRSLIKHRFTVHMYFDEPREQFKRDGVELYRTVHEVLDKAEELFQKELDKRKSRQH